MNGVFISGYLTADPELRTTNSNKSVVSFSVGVRRPFTKNTTDFIDCVAWESNAEFLSKYFRKGSRIEIAGTLQTRTYEKDGTRRKVTEVFCNNIEFGESKKNSEDTANGPQPNTTTEISYEDGDDLPF